MKYLSINDLELFSGIKAHTIRMWEKRYAFLEPKRTIINTRNYSIAEAEQFLAAVLLYHNGYKISKIAGLLPEESEERGKQLTDKEALQMKAAYSLVIALAREDIAVIEKIVEQSIQQWGLTESIKMAFIPFCEKANLLWLRKTPFNYTEQVTYHLMQQKLVQALDEKTDISQTSGTALIFSLPEERAELALLYTSFLLKAYRIKTLIAGELLSSQETVPFIQKQEPSLVITHSIRKKNKATLHQFLQDLSRHSPAVKAILLGAPTEDKDLVYYMNGRFANLESYLQSLLQESTILA
ncbi:MAG: hypothetical protein JWP88_2002 [Flaviaesturariibacter sp.]|nr:hypothetical protein [Flaviaesturariibacter sp.]